MDIIDLIARCRSMGAVLSVEDESLRVVAPFPLPDDLRSAIRAHKTQVMLCLRSSQKSSCGNPFTPHETHEYPWECDPNTCFCYRDFGYPRLCEGVPCRWVWPQGIPINGEENK